MPFRYKATRAEVDDAMSVPGRGRSGVGGAWRWCRLTEIGMLASFCISAISSTVGSVAAFIAAASVSIIAAFVVAASIPISCSGAGKVASVCGLVVGDMVPW